MTISSIVQWFRVAKPKPTDQDLLKQIAFHFEEVSEMLDALDYTCHSEILRYVKDDLLHISEDKTKTTEWLADIDRLALLDACADQVVTAIGVAEMAGMDFEPALAEVNRSNYTKFNADGTPYIRHDGKIGKNPETYEEPELKPFLMRNKGD